MFRAIAACVTAVAMLFLYGSLSTVAAQATSAVVEFGVPDVGSPFPPSATPHDESRHADDALNPRSVTIRAGGSVHFVFQNPVPGVPSVHGMAIYDDGTQPEDIGLGPPFQFFGGSCPPAPYINDATGRIFVTSPPCSGGPKHAEVVFPDPGRYLVICTFLSHFRDAQMFGWVNVQ